ncbi:pentatricopeptide repeat-containing protein At3g54980, mitochondrial-like [Dioscorea cayenensis subsp. rotundata]|uniref:Pentatricopeptide repeat-containing protein At3g54980, mitochondrial-like n=1 Tax=Dioscorea cayennensis subsp. rotundata TaxID=55577 RepID=A0AB40BQD8_DIOCR|nr:pentatricopeptide repeat-containing protein At3g54980, mitochondrial-like [Dioscorea cayenensis subsp. rotundata]
MKGRGFVPTQFIYTFVVGACVKQGNLEEALSLKDELVASGRPLSLVLATSLMKGYCDQGDLDNALDLYTSVLKQGILPNVVTYSVLIDGCCRNGNVGKAFELYCQMKQTRVSPNVFKVNTIINGFLKKNKWKEALVVFDGAVSFGVVNVFTYNILMHWLFNADKVKEACCDLWDQMEERNRRLVVSNHQLQCG